MDIVDRQTMERGEDMTIEDLLEMEAIKRLKARYFRFMDTKQWDAWSMVFTEDATLRVDAGITTWGGDPQVRRQFNGRAEIKAQLISLHQDSVTVHHGHMPEIDITSPTTATGIWAMEDFIDNAERYTMGHGHYHETYRKEADGEWRIASLHLTRLRLESTTGRRFRGLMAGS